MFSLIHENVKGDQTLANRIIVSSLNDRHEIGKQINSNGSNGPHPNENWMIPLLPPLQCRSVQSRKYKDESTGNGGDESEHLIEDTPSSHIGIVGKNV